MIDEARDPTGWERECLRLVRRGLEGRLHREDMNRLGRTLRDVRLTGTPPDTTIAVEFDDELVGHVRTMTFALWGDNFRNSIGSRDPPAVVATIISTNVATTPPPARDRSPSV